MTGVQTCALPICAASGVQDQSRFSLEDGDVNCQLDKRVYKPISSYYASIKNFVPDQYGSIFDMNQLKIHLCDACVREMYDKLEKEFKVKSEEIMI